MERGVVYLIFCYGVVSYFIGTGGVCIQVGVDRACCEGYMGGIPPLCLGWGEGKLRPSLCPLGHFVVLVCFYRLFSAKHGHYSVFYDRGRILLDLELDG